MWYTCFKGENGSKWWHVKSNYYRSELVATEGINEMNDLLLCIRVALYQGYIYIMYTCSVNTCKV